MASAVEWLKDTFMDFFMGSGMLCESPPVAQSRCKAGEDGRGQAKRKQPGDAAYWNTPYRSPSPSRPRGRPLRTRDEKEATRARCSIDDLIRQTSRPPGSQSAEILEGAIERLEVDMGLPIDTSQPTGKLRLKERHAGLRGPEELKSNDSPVGCVSSDVEHFPRQQTSIKKANVSITTRSASSVKATTIPKSATLANDEPWDPRMDINKRWATQPNMLTQECLTQKHHRDRQYVQEELKEPEYALRDAEIRDGLWHMMDLMERLAKKFFFGNLRLGDPREREILHSCWQQLAPETAKIIGCVASGGPGGVVGWENLFNHESQKRALVMAIIGNVLVEQVFQHIFFGGDARHIVALAKLQRTYKDEDGFDRNKHYAATMRTYLLNPETNTYTLTSNFSNHVNIITGALYTHLKPILRMDTSFPSSNPDIPVFLINALKQIVTHAGLLSLSMRLDPHTVYYFEPVLKEDTYASTHMKCFNQHAMEQTNLRTPDDEPKLREGERMRRSNLSAEERKRSRNDVPLTQITILDAVTVYRLGGWGEESSTMQDRVYEKYKFAHRGVRSRILTHGWVFCRWGRARKFKDGKADDNPEVHGNAWSGGFVEFTSCPGVVDWMALEGEERAVKGQGKERALMVEEAEEIEEEERTRIDNIFPSAGPSGTAGVQEDDLQAMLREGTASETDLEEFEASWTA